MTEKNEESFLKNLKKSDYKANANIKTKMLTIVLNVEFNMFINFLKDRTTFKTFFAREMHGLVWSYMKDKQNYYQSNDEFIMVFPKNKGQNLEINDFMINNINSKNMYTKNYVFNTSIKSIESWENFKKIIFRLYIQNEDKINKNNHNKNHDENFNENRIFSDNTTSSKDDDANYIESEVSFYLDINDNSTLLINEFKYDLSENIFLRYYEIVTIFYEKLKNFLSKNFNNYICNESILINRSMNQLYNFLMSRKLFYTKKIVLKNIQKFQNEINIYIDIKDKIYPDSVYQTRCHILKLSNISCFVSVISLIDVKHFSLNKRFLTLKACISLVLKLIKKHVENEVIES